MLSADRSTGDADVSTSALCSIRHRHCENATVLFVVGVLDVMTAPRLGQVLNCVDFHANPMLVVDLTGVDFLSATGMGLLYAAHQRLDQITRVVLVAHGPRTARPLRLVGVADAVDVYPSLGEALRVASRQPRSPAGKSRHEGS